MKPLHVQKGKESTIQKGKHFSNRHQIRLGLGRKASRSSFSLMEFGNVSTFVKLVLCTCSGPKEQDEEMR